MNDDLRLRIRRAAAALKALGAREVYVFGSVAADYSEAKIPTPRERTREGSDIDMAVEGLPPEKFFSAMGAAMDILQRPLDLVDLDEANLFTEFLRRKGKLQRVD